MRTAERVFLYFLLFPGIMFFMWDCTKDKAEPPEGVENGSNGDSSSCADLYESFSQDVKPIFANNCALSGCHNASSAQNGIVLENHGQIKDEVENGDVVCAIEHQSGCTPMPNGQPQLDQDKIKAIKCWRDAGYPND